MPKRINSRSTPNNDSRPASLVSTNRKVHIWPLRVDLGIFPQSRQWFSFQARRRTSMQASSKHIEYPVPWNKGIIMGQKPPLKRSEVWAIRVRLQIAERTRDLAMFNMAIDSKLRSCDLVRLRVRDIGQGSRVSKRAIIMQRKTKNPVQFEITEQTRAAVHTLIVKNRRKHRITCSVVFTPLHIIFRHASMQSY